MKALVATTRTQGSNPRDFSHCPPGKLVCLGAVCTSDAQDPDGPDACGCGRAFSGLGAAGATTTAEVREIDLEEAEFREIVEEGLTEAGWTRLGIDPDEIATELIEIANLFPTGTVLARRGDDLLGRVL